MALVRSGRDYRPHRTDKSGTLEFKLIFGATFVVFLLAALVELLLPFNWFGRRGDASPRKSFIERVSDGARTCAAYAFMG